MDATLRAELKSVAHRLADVARTETLRHFRQGALDVGNKHEAGFDPVTRADREAERAMRRMLSELRPDDAVLGEEFAPTAGHSGLTWILDPVDGTRGFISGTPTWGVLVALADDGGPVFGIIDQPFIGERFSGGLGDAAYSGPRGGAPLRVRNTVRLSEAVLFSTFPEIGTQQEAAAFGRVSDRCRLTRYGMDCYAYALLALGQIDLVIEAGLQPYDIAAPIAVIEAAGGIVTDWQGDPAGGGGQVLAAATPELHRAALSLLAQENGR